MQDRQIRDAEKTALELLGPLDDFRSAQAINHALGKLFSLTGRNRIPVRNAAVLGYIAQLLLQTLRPVRNEIIEAGGSRDLHVVFRDALALIRNEFDRDDPVPPEGTLPRRKPRATVAERVQRGLDRMVAVGNTSPADVAHAKLAAGVAIEDRQEEEQDEEHEEQEVGQES